MKFNPILLAFGLIPLTGCGGGGGDDNTTTSTYTVKAIDGYLRNAQVWLDIDGDYQLDNDEPSAFTGEGGSADLDVTDITSPEQYPVVVKVIAEQTIDEDSITATNPNGSVITSPYILSAPAGQTTITPLSTLIDIKMKNGQTQQEALTELAASLNIDETQVLGDYIENDLGSVAAKASSLVALALLPESETEMSELTDGSSDIDDTLTEDTLISLSAIEENQLLISDNEGSLTTVNIINSDDENYDENADGADKDGDGVINLLDLFPEDITETADNDGDGIGNNSDDFPDDPTETVDTDNDDIGDNSDPDANGDGIIDIDEAGFEYADVINKRFYDVYREDIDTGFYYEINTFLFADEGEEAEFGHGYIDGDEDAEYLQDSVGWTITNGSLVFADYGIRYKLMESTDTYFKVCFSPDITVDATCDETSATYLFFDKANAKNFITTTSTTGTSVSLSDITDPTLNAYFTALEYDYIEQVYYINIDDFGVESIDGLEQFTLLDRIYATYNHITDITALSNLSSLRYIYLDNQTNAESGDDINLDSYSPVLTMPSLTRIILSEYGENAPDAPLDLSLMINGLTDKSTMQYIDLAGVELANADITAILDMPNLERLRIIDTEAVDDFTPLESNTWDNLERLELSWNNEVDINNADSSSDELAALPTFNLDNMIDARLNLSQLTRLSLSQTTVSADDLTTIATGVGSNLERLQLRKILTNDYSNLFNNLNTPNLTQLRLGNYVNDGSFYDLLNIENKLTPSKLERLYLNYGEIINFDIASFSGLEVHRLKGSNITDTTLSEFNTAISQLNHLEETDIRGLTVNGQPVYCGDLNLDASVDCEGDDEPTGFTLSIISEAVWYTDEFWELTFSDVNNTLTPVSFINTEENNGEVLSYTLDDGYLAISEIEQLEILSSTSNSYDIKFTDFAENSYEYFTAYTSFSAFESSLSTNVSRASITAVTSFLKA